MKALFKTGLAASIIAGFIAATGTFQPLQARAAEFEVPRFTDFRIMPPTATMPPMVPPPNTPIMLPHPIVDATPQPLLIAHRVPAARRIVRAIRVAQ